jgi:hypothetical protein
MKMNDANLKAEATEFLTEWVTTFNTDKSRLPDLYSPEASLHGTSSPELFIGRDRIRSYFHGGAIVEVQDLNCRALTVDTALLVGHCVFQSERDGQPVTTLARFTFVMRKNVEGWQVLHHHSSANPP